MIIFDLYFVLKILKMSDEANTPQRSILDFFKTPQKDLTSKPKDLLGFFCKKENSITKTPEITCNGKVLILLKLFQFLK